ncbi:hypothetical protein TorRG33x02_029150, partial [Trema orientale]
IDSVQKLITYGYLYVKANPNGEDKDKLLAKLIESVCKSRDLSDDQIELSTLKTLLSVEYEYTNQTITKVSLIQMLVIVFRRMEIDPLSFAI